MRDAAFLTFVKLLPKKPLSRAVGSATRLDGLESAHRAAIRAFARQYGVAVEEAELPLEAYPTFGDFFTRKLKEGLRPIAPGDDVPVSPVDGAVSHAGVAEKGRLIQAKGRDYTIAALLGDEEEGRRFSGGAYATLYLSPRDYHRFHAPLPGTILGYRYVPGHLWPVNRPSVRGVPELFAVNERVIIELQTPLGRVAMVAVGATCVGRIRLSFDDLVTNTGRPASRVRYDLPRPVRKGEELGMFEMGSTVILVFEPGKVELDGGLQPDTPVKLGQTIGRAIPKA
ncbi:MAG TPA: archaetidylserine decarboxylase [Vulgatibacter sp.]